MRLIRNSYGLTLPFALVLTLIFSFLVGVSYLFVSINLNQLQSTLKSAQAISLAEGINERIKARLNTKSFIMLSPEEESKLDDYGEGELEQEDEELFGDEEFDEETELFSEYYADEVVKISRFITFRNPPPKEESTESESGLLKDIEVKEENIEGENEDTEKAQRPEANVRTIGSITIPHGNFLEKNFKLVLFKDEKFDLMLEDIYTSDKKVFRDKLPLPVIKSLSPNYAEANTRSSFSVIGENLSYDEEARFSEKEIEIEDIKSGPFVEFLVKEEVTPGPVKFFFNSVYADFYIIPHYEGDFAPKIDDIQTSSGEQFLNVMAGERGVILMVFGADLYQNKNIPVIVPDANGIVIKVSEGSVSKGTLVFTLNIDRKVEPGTHSLFLATEGGFSNSWVFNVLPDDSKDLSPSVATFTSSLTLLSVNPIENLLPLIDEDEEQIDGDNQARPDDSKDDDDNDTDDRDNKDDDTTKSTEELSETERLSPFANTDLETTWLLETSVMIGKLTKTVSEVVERRVPKINAAITTNGSVSFNGGGFKIIGSSNASTMLIEATYLSNDILNVPGPPDEEELEALTSDPLIEPGTEGQTQLPQSPDELGFLPGAFVAVYMAGGEIDMLDYGTISSLTNDTIELNRPGLKEFHQEGEDVFQFVPPLISNEEVERQDAEAHLVPKDFSLVIPGNANFKQLFGSNLDQYSELADLYTNDPGIPQDNYEVPIGFMGLTYIDGTTIFNQDNNLLGKGLVIIDTRADNAGKPNGTVEIFGDSSNPAEYTGVIYVYGNLKISGNLILNGALVVENDDNGQIEIASNALGMITYDERAIRQTILSIPWTTKPGSVMISNKSLDLGNYVLSGSEDLELGASKELTSEDGKESDEPASALTDIPRETESIEAEIKPSKGSGAEEELIKFFD